MDLFRKLCDSNVLVLYVRIIMVWYTSQMIFVKREACVSGTFSVCNGVRQDGIFSPILFNVYMDKLSSTSVTAR